MMPSTQRVDLNGLAALRLHGPRGASALITEHGAHLVSWIPAGGAERLYLSERSAFRGGAAIRGGVPVIFPQFSTLGSGRRHGFARVLPWTPRGSPAAEGAATAAFALRESPETLAEWPHPFELVLTVSLGARELALELEVRNSGERPFAFAAALHTYLAVADIAAARLHGLCGAAFRDQTDGGRADRDCGESLAVNREIDRIYAAPAAALTLSEAGRRLRIAAENFTEVVVWNPWEEKCALLTDMPPRGFEKMICVEAALIGAPVALQPGTRWRGRQTLVETA